MLDANMMMWIVINTQGCLENFFRAVGINTRKGCFDKNTISWDKHLARPMEIREAKNGRIYASVGFDATVKWTASLKKNKIFNKGQTIGLTVSMAKGKKGGWYISLHKQKAVLSAKHCKFVFCGYWRHYWASDQMIQAGKWALLDTKSPATEIDKKVLWSIREAITVIGGTDANQITENAW